VVDRKTDFSGDGRILDVDVGDRHLRNTIEVHSTLATLASYIVDIDVLELRSCLVNWWYILERNVLLDVEGTLLRSRETRVVEVEEDTVSLDADHVDVVDVDVTYATTTTTLRLETETYVGTEEGTVLYADVLYRA
jgi:hypothetical protein